MESNRFRVPAFLFYFRLFIQTDSVTGDDRLFVCSNSSFITSIIY